MSNNFNEDLESFEQKILQGVFDEELVQSVLQFKEKEWVEHQRKLAVDLTEIKKSLQHIFGELPEITTTVGVYPTGPSVVNGVQKEHMLYHVYYNCSFRPGRGLIINNRIFYSGSVSDCKLQEELVAHGSKVFESNTAPYH